MHFPARLSLLILLTALSVQSASRELHTSSLLTRTANKNRSDRTGHRNGRPPRGVAELEPPSVEVQAAALMLPLDCAAARSHAGPPLTTLRLLLQTF